MKRKTSFTKEEYKALKIPIFKRKTTYCSSLMVLSCQMIMFCHWQDLIECQILPNTYNVGWYWISFNSIVHVSSNVIQFWLKVPQPAPSTEFNICNDKKTLLLNSSRKTTPQQKINFYFFENIDVTATCNLIEALPGSFFPWKVVNCQPKVAPLFNW